ncbi:HbrB-like-domain-containing protein [Triangularia setosa]|uniref:HbrB-like-domain-containing protein n=1 Tax=Triangularia setosa TaxID=2587417 RepID=A0AAN7A3K1_9PEZI|nr:HbrB-like-domain-containing protein [Podospora setosa]
MQPSRSTGTPGSFSPLPGPNANSTTAASPNLPRPRPRRQESATSSTAEDLNIPKSRGAAPSPTPIYTSFTNSSSTTSLQNFSRPTLSTAAAAAARSVAGTHSPAETILRNGPSPLTLPPASATSPATSTFSARVVSHARKNSQNAGMFEPTLPSTSTSNLSQVVGIGSHHPSPTPHREMSASQIAAQAAVMNHQQSQQQQQQQQAQAQQSHQRNQSPHNNRQRSSTLPMPGSEQEPPPPPAKRGSGGPMNMNPPMLSLTEASGPRENAFGGQTYHNGLLGNHTLAATAAANLVFTRSAQTSPGLSTQSSGMLPPPPPPASEKPAKSEKSKVPKLFSRPVKIGGKSSSSDVKEKPLPSPGKAPHPFAGLQRGNFSTTSLDSSSQSFYSLPNSSSATIRPVDMPGGGAGDRELGGKEKEKEKKHHFLSRQKHKLKDEYHLPLSSAMSNSRPTDPSAPSSLYNFNIPQSPAPSSTGFSSAGFKSGLDLRHGGRALREKKNKEEKGLLDDASSSGVGGSEWPGPSSVSGSSGVTAAAPSLYLNEPFDSHKYGLNNMTHDDAWPFLKAKLLVVFEAEDLRLPVEDINRVVTMHIQWCLARRSPNLIVDDLRELLTTGFSSLDQTLRKTPEDKLIPSLVELWIFTFTVILPYMQAVFLPLDLEFAGNGPLMTAEQSRDFWGGIPTAASASSKSSPPGSEPSVSPASSILEVRRLVLLAFRDIVILPRYDTLRSMFSRLSLEFLPQILASNALASPPLPIPSPGFHNQGMASQLSGSPGGGSDPYLVSSSSLPTSTALKSSAPLDPATASYNSTTTTLFGEGSIAGNRSRAISNVSYGSDGAIPNQFSRPFTPSSLNALGVVGGVGAGVGGASVLSSSLAAITHNTAQSVHSHRDQNIEDSKQVTELGGRMLQCMSVLASIGVGGMIGEGQQEEEEGNKKVEELGKLLKLNWLGRGRTGRNRRGLVGGRVKRGGSGTGVTGLGGGGMGLGIDGGFEGIREESVVG